MGLRVSWSPAALYRRERIHWRVVSDIEADVLKFARTGQGDIESEDGDRPLVRLYAAHGHVLEMRVDLIERTVYILRLYKRR